jgi:hypothetical protein
MSSAVRGAREAVLVEVAPAADPVVAVAGSGRAGHDVDSGDGVAVVFSDPLDPQAVTSSRRPTNAAATPAA